MDIKKMKTLDLIQTLQSLNRDYFTIADLEKITNLSRSSLKVSLSRLVKNKVLIRLKRGIYVLKNSLLNIEKIANQLYYPSYLSFESALSYYGILSQVSYTKTFATNNISKRLILGKTEIEFRRLKSSLFFGYMLKNGIYIAEPEKALLDQLYMVVNSRATINLKELDLSIVRFPILRKYSKKFPQNVQKVIGGIII